MKFKCDCGYEDYYSKFRISVEGIEFSSLDFGGSATVRITCPKCNEYILKDV